VEDNVADAELTLRALRKGGMRNSCHLARDGAEALDFLFAGGKFSHRDPTNVPRLVLLDLRLPRVGGKQVLRRMKADDRTRHIPVVVLTSSRQDRDLRACYHLGVNSYIVKPMDFDQFSAAVMGIGDYWLSLNEPAPGP
jgi:two-component system response regulator